MRVIDIFLVIPPIVIIIIVSAYITPGVPVMIFLLAALFWPGGARIIRAQALSAKERRHVHAARACSAGWFYILRKHIVPDLGQVTAAVMLLDARRAVFMEAGLAFLGISSPSMVSLGKMMRHAFNYYYLDAWKWWLLPTGAALSSLIIGLILLGYALEQALHPRLRKEDA